MQERGYHGYLNKGATIALKHGMDGTRIHNIWKGMRQRCDNPKAHNYHNYGGRGIVVCSEWYDFITFYNWAKAHGYDDNLSIDRKDNNGDYTPDNCKWSTKSEQNRNTRRNKNG